MRTRLALIRQQRAMLRLRASHQRLELAIALEPWSRPLRWGENLMRGMGRLRQHPLMIVAMLIFLISTPRSRLSLWAGRLLSLWEIVQMMRNTVRPKT